MSSYDPEAQRLSCENHALAAADHYYDETSQAGCESCDQAATRTHNGWPVCNACWTLILEEIEEDGRDDGADPARDLFLA